MGESEGPVSVRTRRWVHVFLAVFVITGVARLELWPFTGFRLFSEVRSAERESWQITAVDGEGIETTIRLGELPLAYRNTTRLIDGFDDLGGAERDEVCDAWVAPLRAAGTDVAEVRVYERITNVRPDGPPPVRRLAYACGARR